MRAHRLAFIGYDEGRRASCACGWAGGLWATVTQAEAEWWRHARGAP